MSFDFTDPAEWKRLADTCPKCEMRGADVQDGEGGLVCEPCFLLENPGAIVLRPAQ